MQAALLERGYRQVGEAPPGRHHLAPLLAPELPLVVEVHGRVKWLRGLEAPSYDRLVAHAIPFDEVTGISTLAPADHAALLAVHVWAHDPLTRLLRLVDVVHAATAGGGAGLAGRARARPRPALARHAPRDRRGTARSVARAAPGSPLGPEPRRRP